jgi:hypothetical protein
MVCRTFRLARMSAPGVTLPQLNVSIKISPACPDVRMTRCCIRDMKLSAFGSSADEGVHTCGNSASVKDVDDPPTATASATQRRPPRPLPVRAESCAAWGEGVRRTGEGNHEEKDSLDPASEGESRFRPSSPLPTLDIFSATEAWGEGALKDPASIIPPTAN